jgi:hypothetical protein
MTWWLCISEPLYEPFGTYLAEMGYWQQGLAVSRVSQFPIKFMHDCTFRVRSAVNSTTDHCGQCGGCAFGRLLQMKKLYRLGG